MNAHDLLIEAESIEYFCDALQEHIDRQKNNTLWLIDELRDLHFRAKLDLREFNEKAESAIGDIRRKIESACDQVDELRIEQRVAEDAAKDEAIIRAAIGDEGRAA